MNCTSLVIFVLEQLAGSYSAKFGGIVSTLFQHIDGKTFTLKRPANSQPPIQPIHIVDNSNLCHLDTSHLFLQRGEPRSFHIVTHILIYIAD